MKWLGEILGWIGAGCVVRGAFLLGPAWGWIALGAAFVLVGCALVAKRCED